MPVSFHYQRGDFGKPFVHEFRQGDDLTAFREKLAEGSGFIRMVKASGPELGMIWGWFPTIPAARHREENTWDGDMARFIANHF